MNELYATLANLCEEHGTEVVLGALSNACVEASRHARDIHVHDSDSWERAAGVLVDASKFVAEAEADTNIDLHAALGVLAESEET